MSTQDFLAKSAFTNLEQSIELALSQTEGFRDEAENFADLARRGIRLVPPGVVADLSSFPSNPEGGDAVLVESEDQIYFFDSDSSTWKDSKIIGSAIFANIQGDPSDNAALQSVLDGKADVWGSIQGTLSDQTDLQTALDGKEDVPETGVWTPVWVGSGGGSATYSTQSGGYIEYDSHAILSFALQSDRGTLDGDISIGGMPAIGGFEAGFVRTFRRFQTDFIPRITSGGVIRKNTSSDEFINLQHTDLRDDSVFRNSFQGLIIIIK